MADAPPSDLDLPEPPDVAAEIFGDRIEPARVYAAWLAGAGVERGLLGPREVPRLWDRHLLNCAVLAELMPTGARVADIGSGAGLPGLVLAIARPDLQVCLIEPLLRRVTFLGEVVDVLGVENVEVLRSRAEEVRDREFDVTTSRAVAPLPRLAAWCLPLTAVGGAMVAMKGARATEEIAGIATSAWELSGASSPEVLTCGAGRVDPEVTAVRVVRRRSSRVRLAGGDADPRAGERAGRAAGPRPRGGGTRRRRR